MAGRPSKLNAQGNVIRGKGYFFYHIVNSSISLTYLYVKLLAFLSTFSSYIKHSKYDLACAYLKLLSEKIIIGGMGTDARKFQANFHIFTSHSPNSLAFDLLMKFSCLSLNTIKDFIYTANYEFDNHFEGITIQIY